MGLPQGLPTIVTDKGLVRTSLPPLASTFWVQAEAEVLPHYLHIMKLIHFI